MTFRKRARRWLRRIAGIGTRGAAALLEVADAMLAPTTPPSR